MRARLWRFAGAVILIASAPVGAQTQTQVPAASPPITPAVPALTPSQQAAVILGRWETCIDLAAQFLAYSTLGPKRSTLNVERKCAYFEGQIRPILSLSLTDMMYGASSEQVAAQTEVALESLRRHIHARATAAVKRIRDR